MTRRRVAGVRPRHPADMFAMPDAACAVQLPWKPEVAWVPADPFCRGTPVAHAPRNVLKAQMRRAAGMGLVPKSGVEVEFFLLEGGGCAAAGGSSRHHLQLSGQSSSLLLHPVFRHCRQSSKRPC